MPYLDNILFLLILVIGTGLFIKNLKRVYQTILLGHKLPPAKQKNKSWLLVLKVALGQGKINNKPLVGVLHFLVYVGFFIININILEVLIDGTLGTHRFFATVCSQGYKIFTLILELLALFTSIAVVIFFIRRNIIKIPRLTHPDLKGWATKDANWILFLELIMMWLFFQMNAADSLLQSYGRYPKYGAFPISEFIFNGIFSHFSPQTLVIIERGSWWLHFIGILFFLNYICYSKHLHIILAFPNIWYSYKEKQGQINNMKAITQEIQQMQNPSSENYTSSEVPAKFGVEDVLDLNRLQLLNAYSCVECGRCTEVCPANITGKKLSPRKIMMSVRDRLEEVSNNIKKNGKFQEDHKTLLGNYISGEEIWACTTCMACTDVCPLYIDPVSVIIDMRRFMVMEHSDAPQSLNKIMSNIENSATLWQYSPDDRENWKDELEREENIPKY